MWNPFEKIQDMEDRRQLESYVRSALKVVAGALVTRGLLHDSDTGQVVEVACSVVMLAYSLYLSHHDVKHTEKVIDAAQLKSPGTPRDVLEATAKKL